MASSTRPRQAAFLLIVASMCPQRPAPIKEPALASRHSVDIAIQTVRKQIIRVEGLAFDYPISPRELAAALSAGKAQPYKATFILEASKASPQIISNLTNRDTLPVVTFEFVNTSQTGQRDVYRRVKLIDALITSRTRNHESSIAAIQNTKGRMSSMELEKWWFSFRKIEIENKDGKSETSDNWVTKDP